MHRLQKWSLFSGTLIAISLLFTFGPLTSSAFAATTTARVANMHMVPAVARKALMPTASMNGCPSSLAEGSSGTLVQVLQYRLNGLAAEGDLANGDPYNYSPPLATDGNFGAHTQAAVEDLQNEWGDKVDGGVGPQTWTTLGFCAASGSSIDDNVRASYTACPSTLREGASSTWVSVLQARLNSLYSLGYFLDSPDEFSPYLGVDGSFGPLTNAAVVDFKYWI